MEDIDLSRKFKLLRGTENRFDFAKCIGCSEATVKFIETGKTKTVGLNILRKICQEKKVPLSYFLDDEMTLERARYIYHSEDLLNTMSQFPDSERSQIENIVFAFEDALLLRQENEKRNKTKVRQKRININIPD